MGKAFEVYKELSQKQKEKQEEEIRTPWFILSSANTKDIYLVNQQLFQTEKQEQDFIMQIVKCSIIWGTRSLFYAEIAARSNEKCQALLIKEQSENLIQHKTINFSYYLFDTFHSNDFRM